MKKALLVGINYPGTNNQLNGCVNDVKLLHDLLSTKFGFNKPTHKRVLTDESATTENILERLEWLVEGAQPGDVLFFSYSGHGSQMVSTDYDNDKEPDKKDEIICPIDLDWREKVIKDDDLKRIFSKVPEGVNLTVFLDCCHSGSGTDALLEYKPLGVATKSIDPFYGTPNKNRLMECPLDIQARAFGLDVLLSKFDFITGKNEQPEIEGTLISGCQSFQTSADAWIHNRYQGAATYFLVEALKKYSFDVSYKKLIDDMNIGLANAGYTQRPQLDGSKKYHKKKFLSPLV